MLWLPFVQMGLTALHYAARAGNVIIMTELLSNGAGLDPHNPKVSRVGVNRGTAPIGLRCDKRQGGGAMWVQISRAESAGCARRPYWTALLSTRGSLSWLLAWGGDGVWRGASQWKTPLRSALGASIPV